jgi:hypothetical protein
MTDERIEQLMWQDIDGEISPDDKRALESHIREHPEAGAYYEDLVDLAGKVAAGEPVEPPSALRARIEAAIDWDRYARPGGGDGWLRRFFPATGWDLRVVPVAVTAFVLGIVVFGIFRAGPREVSRYAGAIGVADVGSPVHFDLAAVQGEIAFHSEGDVTSSLMTLTSEQEVQVLIRYAGQTLEFGAMGESPLGDISLRDNVLTIQNTGANQYYFAFRAASSDAPVRIRVSDASGVLAEREWSPSR